MKLMSSSRKMTFIYFPLESKISAAAKQAKDKRPNTATTIRPIILSYRRPATIAAAAKT